MELARLPTQRIQGHGVSSSVSGRSNFNRRRHRRRSTMRLIKYILVAALTAAPAITIAQAPASAQTRNPIVKRQFNQQRRIGDGVKNGQLTPRQGARLERQQMR